MPIWQPTQALAKPTYYDRQPAIQALPFDVTAGQHVPTTRATYTVPAGSRAFLEILWGFILRIGAPATPDFFNETFIYTPSGGSVGNILQLSSSVGGTYVVGPATTTGFGFMNAGDNIKAQTNDDSIGGSAIYRGNIKGVQFPA